LKLFNPTMALLTQAGYSMRIWKLTPTDLTDPIWKKWSPEPIIVTLGARTTALFPESERLSPNT
jgi:hypothetical protein